METIEKTRITVAETPKGLYAAMLNTERYLRECGITHGLLELIKTRVSQINRCGYCIDMHHKDALHEGETFQRLYLLPAWREAPHYSDAERSVLQLTEVLTEIPRHEPAAVEHAYEQMSEHYSKEEIANIVLAICQINSWNRIAIAFGNVPGSYRGA